MLPYDDPNIYDDDKLIRRINPDQHIVFDQNTETKRLSSKAFSASSDARGGMSVDIEKLILSSGQNPKEYVINSKYLGAVSFLASEARQLDLLIGANPIIDNPFHGEVWNTTQAKRLSKRQKDGLMSSCEWFVPLDGVTL